MPAGKDQPDIPAWQEIRGAPGARILPLIRKIDTISSNSYLIATPDILLLIDPGGLTDQAEERARILGECRQVLDRPVFVFLTHAHIDHFVGVQSVPAFACTRTIAFAVQEAGANALEAGDARLTQSSLLNTPVYPMTIALPLLTKERSAMPEMPCSLAFPNGAEITLLNDSYRACGNMSIPRERISFGPGPSLEVYHTPGHSPDSICLKMGDHLFIGDLLFAANPGIAGLSGWSQESLLISLDAMVYLIEHEDIRLVCPGHGRVMPAGDAARMLKAARKDAQQLTGIAELNRERAESTASFANDCMEQVNELFTIMTGRLQYTAYVMNELGEAGMAEEAESLIRGETIDELLEAFRSFSDEHHRGGIMPIHLVLKAGQVIGKLERTFNRDQLAAIIDPALVGRACRLLSDYTTMLRGFPPPRQITCGDLVLLSGAVVTGLSRQQYSDDDVFGSLDSCESFSRILLGRIGSRPLLEEVRTSVHAGEGPLTALIDHDHFTDLIIYILEDLVGTGATAVDISLYQSDDRVVLVINGSMPAECPARKEQRTWRFLQGLADRAGGDLTMSAGRGLRGFCFTAPLGDSVGGSA